MLNTLNRYNFKKSIDKIIYFILVLLSFYPLLTTNKISILILLLFSFSILFKLDVIKDNFKSYGIKPLIINSLFYIVIAFSLSYSPLKEKGLDIIVRNISFLLAPLIFIYSIKIPPKVIRIISGVFILSNIIVFLYFVFRLGLLSKFMSNPEEFFNIRFFIEIGKSDYKDWHPTYMSINYLLSILMILKEVKESRKYLKKVLSLTLVAVFFVFLIILNSRTIIFLTLLAIPTYSILIFKSKRIKILILLSSVASFLLFSQISKSNNVGRLFLEPISYNSDNFNLERVLGPRYHIQKCSIDLISERPFFGYGIGYEKRLLPSYCLEINNFKNQYLNNYSSHNVYLSTLFASGILGLLPLLFMLSNNILLAFRKRSFLYGIVLIIFAFAFLTENYFIRLNGVVLFSFINAYFFSLIFKKIE
ncbi:O-antigen ligase family protein [Winogradskyella jejuensis]|uniref:O-antigen ligase n=1 Tax=Winogradskyella jejuensis TaxID=1089305 RepID=A0A1M5MU78_9FLAO|nr:O-antigen ligase family protein [Winogradskyella jejuensis]SHG80459.1 O-antigen ligase [Winogradskyella jejuensis]